MKKTTGNKFDNQTDRNRILDSSSVSKISILAHKLDKIKMYNKEARKIQK